MHCQRLPRSDPARSRAGIQRGHLDRVRRKEIVVAHRAVILYGLGSAAGILIVGSVLGYRLYRWVANKANKGERGRIVALIKKYDGILKLVDGIIGRERSKGRLGNPQRDEKVRVGGISEAWDRTASPHPAFGVTRQSSPPTPEMRRGPVRQSADPQASSPQLPRVNSGTGRGRHRRQWLRCARE